MKKFLTSLIVLILVLSCSVAIFAACDDEGGGSGGGSAAYNKTIYFYSSQGQSLTPITETAIQKFQAKYPGWTVVHTTQGGYDDVKDKILGDLQAGQQPDVAYCYADHVASYLETGKVVNIKDLLNSTATVKGNVVELNDDDEWVATGETKDYAVGYDYTNIVSGYYEEGKAINFANYARYGYQRDDILTLPFSKSTELLYYNEDALKAAGIVDKDGNAKPAETWDELWAHCKIIKDKWGNAVTPLGYDSEANWFITMCQQNGWPYTTANGLDQYLFAHKEARDWLNQLREYFLKGYFATQDTNGGYTSGLFTLGVGQLNGVEADQGGAVYCIGSSAGASKQVSTSGKWKVGIAQIPGSIQYDEDGNELYDDDGDLVVNRSCISQGPSLVMFKGGRGVTNADEKVKMTFLFVQELLDAEFQADFSIGSGYNPAVETAFQVPKYINHLNGSDNTAVAAKMARSLSSFFFTSPAFDGSSTARTQVGNALIYAIKGEKSATDALRDAYRNCSGKESTLQ